MRRPLLSLIWTLILAMGAIAGGQPPAEGAMGHPSWRPDDAGIPVGMTLQERDPFGDLNYHRLKSTRELPRTKWTHVQVEGVVLAVLDEEDGDLHLRLTDGTVSKCTVPAYMEGQCIVAEIRPGTRTKNTPRKGDTIRVFGISRYDRGHSWWEVHPVDRWELVAHADKGRP